MIGPFELVATEKVEWEEDTSLQTRLELESKRKERGGIVVKLLYWSSPFFFAGCLCEFFMMLSEVCLLGEKHGHSSENRMVPASK